MKLFFVIAVGLWLAPAFSQNTDLVGLWVWSGTGCRDHRDLNAESHSSRSKSDGLVGIQASQIRLYPDGRAEMTTTCANDNPEATIVCENAGIPERQTGFYQINDNEVVINEEDFILNIVEDRLLVVGTHEESEKICDANGRKLFVYVMGKVDNNPDARP